MNARAVSAAAGVVHAAMQTRSTAAGIAAAVDAAGLLMSPETAAELARLRGSAAEAHRRIAEVLDYLATKDAVKLSEDAGVMGFHIVAVLDGPGLAAAERAEQRAEAEKRQADYAEAVATVARLEQKRVELERIANVERERVAELEQQLAAVEAERANQHDDLAGALGRGTGTEWSDLVDIATASMRTAEGLERAKDARIDRVRAFAVSHEYRWLLELLDGPGTHGGVL